MERSTYYKENAYIPNRGSWLVWVIRPIRTKGQARDDARTILNIRKVKQPLSEIAATMLIIVE